MISVLDTCALLWLTLDPSELSPAAHQIIRQSERLLVSSISIWEIGIKVKRKKLDLGVPYSDYVRRVAAASDLELVAVDHTLWAKSVLLEWNHPDPADRVIVALAQQQEARLISGDRLMAEFFAGTVA